MSSTQNDKEMRMNSSRDEIWVIRVWGILKSFGKIPRYEYWLFLRKMHSKYVSSGANDCVLLSDCMYVFWLQVVEVLRKKCK